MVMVARGDSKYLDSLINIQISLQNVSKPFSLKLYNLCMRGPARRRRSQKTFITWERKRWGPKVLAITFQREGRLRRLSGEKEMGGMVEWWVSSKVPWEEDAVRSASVSSSVSSCSLNLRLYLWCGVVWCGVVWCGVVWCSVVMVVSVVEC